MNQKDNQCQLSFQRMGFQAHIKRALQQSLNTQTKQDIIQKIKNSICFILQACDQQNLQKSTKFIALSIFLRYVTKHVCFTDENFMMLILCSLRLSAKFNEASHQSIIFDNPCYIQMLDLSRSQSDILQFEIQLFSSIDFKIYVKSPYQYLEEMAYNRELPTGFINAVDGYIDFALTLLDLSKCSGEEIFAGSLAALKRSKDIQNKELVSAIEETCAKVHNADKIGAIIIQNWQNILLMQEQ